MAQPSGQKEIGGYPWPTVRFSNLPDLASRQAGRERRSVDVQTTPPVPAFARRLDKRVGEVEQNRHYDFIRAMVRLNAASRKS